MSSERIASTSGRYCADERQEQMNIALITNGPGRRRRAAKVSRRWPQERDVSWPTAPERCGKTRFHGDELLLNHLQQQKQRCAAKEHHHHQHQHLQQQQQQHLQQIHPSLNWNCSANMVAARLVASLCLLAGFSLQVDVKSAKEAGKAGNFMEDEQWLSTISQYSRKIKHWNRFRDHEHIVAL
ncbi:Testican-2 SPARC/osteonectin, CWCV, and [Takifugu flavidus]|uniref:Testican-2 SPARC/osteonectin, CWCV, and n=1 Tax=Takifugu flavidus TaxID=433684 RepID=A0A5C6PT30_9TELE|nr:Testican-2 SPARC/osteonectin, CWCV, and [Takifugu flavidus]